MPVQKLPAKPVKKSGNRLRIVLVTLLLVAVIAFVILRVRFEASKSLADAAIQNAIEETQP